MSAGRKRTTDRHYSAEDQALDQISKEAEERIQARRQARAEAREIRLKEIERQQREEEEKQKAQQQGIDSSKSLSSYSGSRRGSNDSTESDVSSKDSKDPKDQARQLKGQLRELEEKYKAAMVTNAQLDNVKTSHVFQVELLKEQLEEQEETMIEVQREYKDKCRDYELLKRDFEALKLECDGIKHQIEVKDKLLKESGLVIVTSDEGELSLTKCASMDDVPIPDVGTAIISEEAADMLKRAGEGTLGKPDSDVRVNAPESRDTEAALGLQSKREGTNSDENIDMNETVGILKDSDKPGEAVAELTEKTDKETVVLVQNKTDDDNDKPDGGESKKRASKNEVNSDSESEVFYESQTDFSPIEVEVHGNKDECMGEVESMVDQAVKAEKHDPSECVGTSVEILVGGESTEGSDVDNIEIKEIRDELLFPKRKSGNLGLRRVLLSDSCISMESDVTYHSESEDQDLEDVTIHGVAARSSEAEQNETLSSENIDTCRNESVSDVVFDEFNGLRIPQEVDFSELSGKTEDQGGNKENESVLKAEMSKNIDTLIKENLETVLSVVQLEEAAEEKVDIVHTTTTDEGKESGLPSVTPFDDVFMSMPLANMGFNQSVENFVRNYVKDVITKSVDLFNKELADEKVTVRKESHSKAHVNISVSKRHYSDELIDTASSIFPKKLSSGSVEILSPIVSIPSGIKGDLKFFSYKVDTDADIVLTSIEEEKSNPKEGFISLDNIISDSVQSPVSGFGIYYTGLAGHSDIDSEQDSDEEADNIPGDSTGMQVEFSAMPVVLESSVGDESKNVLENSRKMSGNGYIEEVKDSKVEVENVNESRGIERQEGMGKENEIVKAVEGKSISANEASDGAEMSGNNVIKEVKNGKAEDETVNESRGVERQESMEKKDEIVEERPEAVEGKSSSSNEAADEAEMSGNNLIEEVKVEDENVNESRGVERQESMDTEDEKVEERPEAVEVKSNSTNEAADEAEMSGNNLIEEVKDVKVEDENVNESRGVERQDSMDNEDEKVEERPEAVEVKSNSTNEAADEAEQQENIEQVKSEATEDSPEINTEQSAKEGIKLEQLAEMSQEETSTTMQENEKNLSPSEAGEFQESTSKSESKAAASAANVAGGSDKTGSRTSANLSAESGGQNLDSDNSERRKGKKKSIKQKGKDEKRHSKDDKKLTKEEKKTSKEECVVS